MRVPVLNTGSSLEWVPLSKSQNFAGSVEPVLTKPLPTLTLREERGTDLRDDLLCTNLTVTGDYQTDFSGSYIISDEKASYSPNKPVYKLEGQNKYIYYSNSH